MGLLLLLGAITLCATLTEARILNCFIAEGECSKHIKFWLHSRNTGDDGFQITESNIAEAPFILGPLNVIILGYTAKGEYNYDPQLVPAYRKKRNHNILTVNWDDLTEDGCYLTAMLNTGFVGKCTAEMLQKLYVRWPKWRDSTHIIGFSLGAHVAGVVGYQIKNITRITGLDPAFLGFSTIMSRARNRLDPSDANFVDIYHSNGGDKGRPGPLGHVDFYLNNGKSQPGCKGASCSHYRSLEVFTESITTPNGFFGESCEPDWFSAIIMQSKDLCSNIGNNTFVKAGQNVDKQARGSFKVETNDKKPYATGPPKKPNIIKDTPIC